jgi:hypothetical protein
LANTDISLRNVLLLSPERNYHGDTLLVQIIRLIQLEALFIWLIICLIQLVFSAGIVFFSHKKSVNSVFQPAYNFRIFQTSLENITLEVIATHIFNISW